MNYDLRFDDLRIQHTRLDAAIREEEGHVWKNLIKIEALKKEKLKKKDALLRMHLHSVKS